ncbi:hypothetical protein RB195_005317 [Necator americanus]|uniref:Uncharacterized protein n=1 Tax=Necator americanus TaxID=51031 RepID=A0ABR1BR48_NECAM
MQCVPFKRINNSDNINRRLKRVIQLGPPPVSPDCPTSPLFSGSQPLPPPPGCPPPLSPSRSSKQFSKISTSSKQLQFAKASRHFGDFEPSTVYQQQRSHTTMVQPFDRSAKQMENPTECQEVLFEELLEQYEMSGYDRSECRKVWKKKALAT